MRLLYLLGSLLIVHYENLVLIGASPILLSTEAYSSASAASGFLVARAALSETPIADMDKPVLENRGTPGPAGVGTSHIAHQEQQPHQPENSALCTAHIGDNRQSDVPGTNSMLYAKSVIACSQMDSLTAPINGWAISELTAAQEASSAVVGIVGSISGDVIMDVTGMFPMTPVAARGETRSRTKMSDVTHDVHMAITTASHPVMMMATPVATALDKIECFPQRSAASKSRRQMCDDPLDNLDGPPLPPPQVTMPPHPPRDSPPPLPDSSCSSPSPTNSPQAASASDIALSNMRPSNPHIFDWIHCVGSTIAVVAFMVWVFKRLRKAQLSPPVPKPLEACDHTEPVYPGSGRRWGNKRMSSFTIVQEWVTTEVSRILRNMPINHAGSMVQRRVERAMDDARPSIRV